MKKGLLRFFITILIVLSGVVAIDILIGQTMDWMLPQISNQGDTGKTYFALNEVNTPIVIVGSSRASHHYNSKMIEDSLRLATYNVGRDACFFSYNCCIINSILDRYQPEFIIWENSFDYLFENISDPVESLYPYFNSNSYIADVICKNGNYIENIPLYSSFYRLNSILHRIVIRFMNRKTFADRTIMGYDPLQPKVLLSPLELLDEDYNYGKVSDRKIEMFREVLLKAKGKGVTIVVIDSPYYRNMGKKSKSHLEMQKICKALSVPMLDNTHINEIIGQPEYFNDPTHLNRPGADAYTNIVIEQLNQIINK